MQLSNSALSIFKDCPRCFWVDKNEKIKRPRGIFSSLPNGIDVLLKKKLEEHRGGLPGILSEQSQLEGFTLYDGSDLRAMRHWKTNPHKMVDLDGNTVVGAFDDLLYNKSTGEYAVLDYKTKGSKPDIHYCEKYYQTQADLYTRLLQIGGKKIAPFSALLYFWPVESKSALINFACQPFFLTPNPEAAETLFSDAINCLQSDMPTPSASCEYCKYVAKRLESKI